MDKIFKDQWTKKIQDQWIKSLSHGSYFSPQHLELCFYVVTIPKCWQCFFSPLRRMCVLNDNKYCQELRDFSTLKHLSFYTPASYSVLWVHFSSVTQLCPTLCDPMNHSTPGLSVQHQLPEFTQTRVHWVGDAIQPSHPLSSSSPPSFNLFQHQGLF